MAANLAVPTSDYPRLNANRLRDHSGVRNVERVSDDFSKR